MKLNVFQKNAGFTLLEVVLSLSLLLIMGMGTMSASGYIKSGAIAQEDRLLAMQAMDKKLSEYRGLDPTNLRGLANNINTNRLPDVVVPQLTKLNGSSREPAVIQSYIEPAVNGDTGYRKFDMKVEWDDYGGKPHTAFLTGVIYLE